MSLSNKVIKSGFWRQLSQIIQIGSHFVISAILARLLSPTDFGLVGIATLYANFLTQFTIIGLTLAIIQKNDIVQSQLSSIFWVNLGFGFFTALVVSGSAPLAAGFYNKPELVPLILLYSTVFIISPFFQVHRRLLEKEIQFNKISKIEIFATLGSGVVGCVLAFIGFGVYSILWQTISMNIIYLVMTRMNIKWKPDYHCSLKEIKDMIYFSLKMKGARLANFLERNIDFLILSKLFDIQLFGFYSLAYRIMYFPVRRISNVFSEILFPVFSKIQDNKEKIRIGYLKSIQLVAMASIPISVILAVLAKPLVLLLLGKKWLPVSGILLPLSIAGLLQSIEVISDSIFPALDKPQTLLVIEILRFLVTGIAVAIGALFGLLEVALAILMARALLFIINFRILKSFIRVNFIDIVRKMMGPLFSGVITFLLLSLLADRDVFTLLSLTLTLVTGIVVYTSVVTICNFKDLKYFFSRLSLRNHE